jgi:Leucine-rich repeat (LRR) protein
MEITPNLLKEYCKKDGLYSTPHLNDRLYLHYKGFRAVTNLEAYTGLKVLWLEGNGLTAISGLSAQTEMRTLYLQENLLERIENLEHMVGAARAPAAPRHAQPTHPQAQPPLRLSSSPSTSP